MLFPILFPSSFVVNATIPIHDIDVDWEQYYPVGSQIFLTALEEPFTKEEIHRAVLSLGADKAPGTDGFNIKFYQHLWTILCQNFIDIFQAFYDGNLDLTRFNKACIALVPKIARARRIGDFRPINLINSILKNISKVLAGRLKEKISNLIELSESAFLLG